MSLVRRAYGILLIAGVVGAGVTILLSGGRDMEVEGEAGEALRQDPLAGAPFAMLARAEADPDRRLVLHEIAARRAPRDLLVRAWLAEHYLAARRPSAAMAQLDVILRLSRETRATLIPVLLQRAGEDDAFADALAARLATWPDWRPALLKATFSGPSAPGAVAVLTRLADLGHLGDDDRARWIDALMRAGQWGMAYSLWAQHLDLKGEPLPLFWNGAFDRQSGTGAGFDWRVRRVPGTYAEFVPRPGGQGRAAHLVFLGRPVAKGGLEHALQLPPGRYRLLLQVRAEGLESHQGLEWMVACSGGKPRFPGERLSGSFDWRPTAIDFHIPITGCGGQWLRLVNPAPAGSARLVSGELWVDEVVLERLTATWPPAR